MFYPNWDKIGKYENGKYIIINKEEVDNKTQCKDLYSNDSDIEEGYMSDKSVTE
jgi:hypothetical protein